MRNKLMFLLFIAAICTAAASSGAEMKEEPQSFLNTRTTNPKPYPLIVLYSVSWCPHCREAKEYLKSRGIPFINLDVELDDSAMDKLVNKYKMQSVPLIVIGNDDAVLRGFDPKVFEETVRKLKKP